jgi:hypothetical protein
VFFFQNYKNNLFFRKLPLLGNPIGINNQLKINVGASWQMLRIEG